MAGESILSGETGAAGAFVGFVTSVNLGVTLEVMLAHEALAAPIASKLTIAKMGLDMGSDVFPTSKRLVAPRE